MALFPEYMSDDFFVAGKTSLTNYFSNELGVKRLLEDHEKNLFPKDIFMKGSDITFETEITFFAYS